MTVRVKTVAGLLAVLCVVFLISSACALTIPGDRGTVEARAYYGDRSLSDVIMEEGIVSIGSKAFANSSLREIALPASLVSIADDAFEGCSLDAVHAEKGTYAYQWMREKGYIAEYKALLIGEQDFIWFYDEENPDDYYWGYWT